MGRDTMLGCILIVYDFCLAYVCGKGVHVTCYHISVEPEDLKKLGSALNALSNEKSKQQKVGVTYRKHYGELIC